MTTLNGQLNGNTNQPVGNGKRKKSATKKRRETLTVEEKSRPAHVIEQGRIVTRIWAELNNWGGITWRVDQYRVPVPNYLGATYHSFHFSDLQDAMRGLYRAKQWVKKSDRQYRRRRWFGNW